MLKARFWTGLVLCLSLVSAGDCLGQNTASIRGMSYNLLYYRQTTSSCTGANNSASAKDGYFKTLAQYIDPDFVVCNEIGSNPVNADRILDNVLNQDGVTAWAQANYSNNSFSDLVNMLFYNADVLGLHSQESIDRDLQNQSLVRVIDLYRLYYKDPLLGQPGADTVFFTVVAAHLKAGDTPADETQRDKAAEALMQHLANQVSDEYVLLCGDLNVYSSSEPSFQKLVNSVHVAERFKDPVNALGAWNNSAQYAAVHTQSTRSSNTNSGCFSGGGLDDRFDFILVSDRILNDPTADVRYVSGSYKALGNDGMHFNKALTDAPVNNSVPSVVLTALYEMSDHLPITAVFEVRAHSLGLTEAPLDFSLIQPVRSGMLELRCPNTRGTLYLELYDLSGRNLIRLNGVLDESGRLSLPIQLSAGTYVLGLIDENGNRGYARIAVAS